MCAHWKLPSPPPTPETETSVTSDLGFSPPSSGAAKPPRPLSVVRGQRHSCRPSLGLGASSQLWGGVGSREAGQAGTHRELLGDRPAVVSTASPCLQMFIKACEPRPLALPCGFWSCFQPPESEVSDSIGRSLGAVTPASNYRFPAHYSSRLPSGSRWSLRITSLFK